jgi:CHAT domain-containing protein
MKSLTIKEIILSFIGTTWVLLALQPAMATASTAAGKATLTLGSDPAGRVCTARRVFGDPLLRDASRDLAYDISCGRGGTVGRVYRLDSRPSEQALREWREEVAPLCVTPRPQEFLPEGMRAELGLFCAGGTTVGTRPAVVLLAASGPKGLVTGDAPPTAAPVVELAMRIIAGVAAEPTRARERGPRSALLSNLETVLGGDLTGGGFADFSSLRAAAFENNALWLFGSAELQFADALRLHAVLWPNDLAGRADLQAERGLNLANQRRFAEAERVLAEAAASAEKAADPFLRAKVAAYLALASLNASRFAEAETRATRAREFIDEWRRTGRTLQEQADPSAPRLPVAERVIILEAQMLRVRALVAGREAGRAGGREDLAQAAALIEGLDARAGAWLRAGLAADRATLALQEGEPELAARLLEEALAVQRQVASGTRIEANLLMDLGAALQAQSRESAALERFAQAFQIYLEQTENRGVSPARGLPYLEALAARLPALATPAEAADIFAAFEALAAPAVAQTAATTAARLLAGPNGGVIRAWQDAERSLRRALTRLSNLPLGTSLEIRRNAEGEVAEWRARVSALEQQVARFFPNFGVVTLEPVTLESLRASLGKGERLLRLALGADRGIGLLIERDQVRVFRIGIGESRAALLVSRIKDSVRDTTRSFDRAAAAELYTGLFGTLDAALLDPAAPERLIIETNGALSSLPFSILITDAADAEGEAWLARRFAVLSVPSMRAFVSARAAGPAGGSIPFAGYGDFLPLSEAPDPEAIVRSMLASRRLPVACETPLRAALAKLPRLRGTAAELEAVKDILGSGDRSVRLREGFTEAAVLRDRNLETARVVMFSTHGVFGTDFPEAEGCLPEAALLTSATGDSSNVFLDSSRVLELKLDADLVVLSACNTGNPQPVAPGETGLPSGGDALSGLARSFFYAGARSVLVSHWVIPDEDTVALMRAFFERLQAGEAAPEALRAAQLAQIRAGADDPLQWAALAIVGSPLAR